MKEFCLMSLLLLSSMAAPTRPAIVPLSGSQGGAEQPVQGDHDPHGKPWPGLLLLHRAHWQPR